MWKAKILNVSILTVLVLTLVLSGSAFAISNPNDVSIEKVFVWNNLWVNGDWLFYVEYDIDYTVTPTESAEDTYLVVIYDENDNLVATNPLNYYDYNIISVYLTPSQISTKGLDWDELDNYTIKVSGNPAYFAPLVECPAANCNQDTYAVDANADVYDNPMDYNRSLLGELMLIRAGVIEDVWSIDLLTDSGRLNTAGSLAFKTAIPGMDQLTPESFESSLSVAEVPDITKVSYLYPNASGSETAIASQFPNINSHYDKVNWTRNMPNSRGVADSGSPTAVVDATFNQADNFWNSATLTITQTADGGPPQNESEYVSSFNGTTGEFILSGTLSAAVQATDRFSLDYSDTYVYTSSTSLQADLYHLDSFSFVSDSSLKSVTVHFNLQSSDDGEVYGRPFISLSGLETVGEWRMAAGENQKLHAAEKMARPSEDSTWRTSDIEDLQVGIEVYSGDGVSQVRIDRVFVEIVYTVPDWTGAYARGLKDNMGNRLTQAMNGFGEWIGVPGTIVAGIGAFIVYLLLAGRIFVATGNVQAAIALSIPFLLIGSYLGMIPLYVIFAVVFIVILLFGITFILARLS